MKLGNHEFFYANIVCIIIQLLKYRNPKVVDYRIEQFLSFKTTTLINYNINYIHPAGTYTFSSEKLIKLLDECNLSDMIKS